MVEARMKGTWEWRPYGLTYGRHSTLFGLGGLLALVSGRIFVGIAGFATSDASETGLRTIPIDQCERVSECHISSLRSSSQVK
ncbi:MAG: hypothetical protein JWN12_818 [Candidatus Saccharibacteria bacterium]|nr:hypothetical protein [Candidatus Saccharibacteria bacterium]